MHVRPGFDADVTARQEGEIVVVLAGSAKPVVLDPCLVVFAADHSDDSAIAQIAQYFIAGWVETFVHHGAKSPAEFWMRSARQSYQVKGQSVDVVRLLRYLGDAGGEIGLCGRILPEYTHSLSFEGRPAPELSKVVTCQNPAIWLGGTLCAASSLIIGGTIRKVRPGVCLIT